SQLRGHPCTASTSRQRGKGCPWSRRDGVRFPTPRAPGRGAGVGGVPVDPVRGCGPTRRAHISARRRARGNSGKRTWGGPSTPPQGATVVDKAPLMAWWNSLREHYDSRTEEAARDAEVARLSVSDTSNYERSGTVVPGIGGGVRKRKKPRSG